MNTDTITLNISAIQPHFYPTHCALQLFTGSEGVPTSTLHMEVESGDEDAAVRTYLAAWRRREVDTGAISFRDNRRWLEAATTLRVTRGTRHVAMYSRGEDGYWTKENA